MFCLIILLQSCNLLSRCGLHFLFRTVTPVFGALPFFILWLSVGTFRLDFALQI